MANNIQREYIIRRIPKQSKSQLYQETKLLSVMTNRADLLLNYIGSTKEQLRVRVIELKKLYGSIPQQVLEERKLLTMSRASLWNIYKEQVDKDKRITYSYASKKVLINILNLDNRIKSLIQNLTNDEEKLNVRIDAFNDLFMVYNFRDFTYDMLLYFFRELLNGKFVLKYKKDGDVNFKFTAINESYYMTLIQWIINKGLENISDNYITSDNIKSVKFKDITYMMIEPIVKSIKPFTEQSGKFFKWYNTTNIDLTQEQIYSKDAFINSEDNNKENCFINVLLESKFFSKSQINKIKIDYRYPSFSKTHIKKIANEYNVNFVIKQYNPKSVKSIKKDVIKVNADKSKTLHINLLEGHYFIDRELHVSNYYVKNYKKINKIKDVSKNPKYMLIRNKRGDLYKNTTNNMNIIIEMFKNNLFKQDGEILASINFQVSTDTVILDNICNEQRNLDNLDNEPKEIKLSKNEIFFCDLESDTTQGNHKIVMSQYMHIDDKDVIVSINDPVKSMFNYILNKMKDKSKTAILYFHNAKYDFSLLKPHINNLYDILRKDGAFYNAKFFYNGFKFEIRDSYKLIPTALKNMPAMFNLPIEYHKNEAIAYSYHNEKNIRNKCEKIDVYKQFLDEKLHKTFDDILNNNTVKCAYNKINNTFNPLMYYSEYGRLDVLILKESMMILNKEMFDLMPTSKINIFNKLTISSIALASVKDTLNNVTQTTGNLRNFIDSAIYGGRVHVNHNYKGKIIEECISDFDACSMYPSAMIRLCDDYGLPTKEFTNIKNFNKTTMYSDYNKKYYVVKIRITKINKQIQIPVVCIKTKDGSSYINNLIKPEIVTVDKITLEDYVKYQDIEFEFIEGVKVSLQDSNKQLGKKIFKLYNKRLEIKHTRKSMGELIKLILNSIYGKTCPKRHYNTEKVVKTNKYNDYVDKNFHKIQNIDVMNDTTYIIKEFKPAVDDYTYNIVGCMILSMSKRMMNEVFNICDNQNMPIYYTDTDSMHINKKDIQQIQQIYKELYNKELIGDMPEQFHSDFKLLGKDGIDIKPEKVISTESIFLGKKCYFDKLYAIDDKDNKCYGTHYRMKGIPEKSLINHCKIHFNGDMFKLYRHLTNKNNKCEIIINFNQFNPSFQYDESGVHFRLSNSFIRTLKF